MTYVHRQLLSRTTEAGTLVQLPPALQRDQLSFGWVSGVVEQACWAFTTPRTRARAVSLAYILLSLGRPGSLGKIVGDEKSVVERMEVEQREDRVDTVFYRQIDNCFGLSLVISSLRHLRLVPSMSADSDRCERNLAETSRPVAPGHPTRRANGPNGTRHREATLSPPPSSETRPRTCNGEPAGDPVGQLELQAKGGRMVRNPLRPRESQSAEWRDDSPRDSRPQVGRRWITASPSHTQGGTPPELPRSSGDPPIVI